MCPSFGKTALQLAFSMAGSASTPCAPEWHTTSVDRGMPAKESSSAGSSVPVNPPSWGSSRKIALGGGRWSAACRLAMSAVMMPPNEKPK